MRIWARKCCITGLAIERLLRASHIKPWKDCNNQERLDAYNGLLLSPSYDAAFDHGFISFDDSGHILVSNEIKSEQLNQLGISAKANILGLRANHKKYLAYHRKEVFLR
jgi:predicted restriction endonuclease